MDAIGIIIEIFKLGFSFAFIIFGLYLIYRLIEVYGFQKDIDFKLQKVIFVGSIASISLLAGIFIEILRWLVKDENEPIRKNFIRTVDGAVLSLLLGTIMIVLLTSVYAFIQLLIEKQASRLFNKEKQLIDSLVKRETQLIQKVEDATRSVIFGFASIFNKSLDLIQHAEEELWIVNFMIEFGKPHLVNKRISDDYRRQYKKSFEEDVAIYHKTLKTKFKDIPQVRILTVTDEGVTKNFLEPLKEARSDEYAQLDIHEIKKSFIINKAQIETTMNDRNSKDDAEWNSKDHSMGFCESDKLPLQMILADRGNGKVGCLVFLVGTEVLRGIIKREELESDFIEAGVYTELPDMIRIYRFLIASLLNEAQRKRPLNC